MNLRLPIFAIPLVLSILILTVPLKALAGDAQHRQQSKLITPTLWSQFPNQFACNLTNVSDQTRTIRVRVISNGKILDDRENVSVKPLHTVNYYIKTPHGPENPRGAPIYCEFTVEGPITWYRGAAKIFPAEDSGNLTDLVAIPAE